MTDEVRVRPSARQKRPTVRPIADSQRHIHVNEVALGGSVHETGIRWDVLTFPLVGHTKNVNFTINNTYCHALVGP